MSLDDDDDNTNATAVIQGDREAFFSDPTQAHNRLVGEGSMMTMTTSSSIAQSHTTALHSARH